MAAAVGRVSPDVPAWAWVSGRAAGRPRGTRRGPCREPEVDEAEAVRWVPVEQALEMIRTGEIIGGSDGYRRPDAVAERMRRNSPHNTV